MTTKTMLLMCMTTAMFSSAATVLLLRGTMEAHANAPTAQEKILQAEKFVLVDDKGVQRGLWELTQGMVRLTLCNKEGKGRLDLRVGDDESSSVDMYDRDRKYRISLGLDRDGSPSLYQRGKDQSSVNVLRVDANGKGSALVNTKELK